MGLQSIPKFFALTTLLRSFYVLRPAGWRIDTKPLTQSRINRHQSRVGIPKGARILARRQSSQFGAERIDAALGTPRRIPLHGLADFLVRQSADFRRKNFQHMSDKYTL
jgi:hypothetical protein